MKEHEEQTASTKVLSSYGDLEDFVSETEHADSPLPRRIKVDPEQVERGLAKLVLTLIELLRRLLERQAVRRIEGGSLTDDEIERLGDTFMKLNERMEELKVAFGLEGCDLNLNLGPLGDLM
ncbi:MAG: gas vesicle protein K [Armatimonadetes bacterium]|nr:gas vesicle protein K [Armatimonadota bacterium]